MSEEIETTIATIEDELMGVVSLAQRKKMTMDSFWIMRISLAMVMKER